MTKKFELDTDDTAPLNSTAVKLLLLETAAAEREEAKRKQKAASKRMRDRKREAGLVRVGCEVHETNRALAAHVLRELQLRLAQPQVRMAKADLQALVEAWNAPGADAA